MHATANRLVASRASKSKASNAWEAYKKKQHNIVGDAASIVSKAGSLGSG